MGKWNSVSPGHAIFKDGELLDWRWTCLPMRMANVVVWNDLAGAAERRAKGAASSSVQGRQ